MKIKETDTDTAILQFLCTYNPSKCKIIPLKKPALQFYSNVKLWKNVYLSVNFTKHKTA